MDKPLTAAELMALRAAVCRRMRWVARVRQRLVDRGVIAGDMARLTKAALHDLHDLQVGLHYAAVAADRGRAKGHRGREAVRRPPSSRSTPVPGQDEPGFPRPGNLRLKSVARS